MLPIRTQSASLSDSGVRKSGNWLNKAIERGTIWRLRQIVPVPAVAGSGW